MPLANPRFEQSYARIFGPGVTMNEGTDDFFQAFYARFLEHPEVAALFTNTDLQRQVGMLKKSLFQLISYYVVGGPTAELERLGQVHKQLGISSALLDLWMQALVDTARQFDPEFDEAAELGWCWALSPVIAYMQLVMTEGLPDTGTSN